VDVRRRLVLALAATAAPLLLAGASSGAHAALRTGTAAAPARYAFPLHVSANGRYLVDRRNRPFLVVGDSPQALIGDLSVAQARAFIADRRSHGINALWVNLLCAKYTGCADDGRTRDGIAPFTTAGDLAAPNPAYFARADAMVRLAQEAGMVVFLDPIETGGWLPTLRSNGAAKAYAYGKFLGKRFRGSPNIVWLNGNDFQTWESSTDDALALAVARGIRSVDKVHLQTVELNYYASASRDDARWKSLLNLDLAYTYLPTYAEVGAEYALRPPLPVILGEAGYEDEQNEPTISFGSPQTLRRQEYWAALSGAAGQFFGNHFTWQFAPGWKNHLDSPGSVQLRHLVDLLSQRPWFRLVPDTRHQIVTHGYGEPSSKGPVDGSDYVTTAATPDGKLAISYLPNGGTLTVDTTRLEAGITARWFDPTSGRLVGDSAGGLPRSANVMLRPPGKNGDGDPDWVLVLS
jgi:hypothetical protein